VKTKLHRIELAVIGLAFLILTGIGINAGCEQVQHIADDVRYVTGGPPASQPTTHPTTQQAREQAILDTARGVVGGAAVVYPPIGQIVGLVSVLAGAVAGVAGHFNGKRVQSNRNVGIVTEILGEVAAYKNPAEPWSATTEKFITDVAGFVEAQTGDE
jgi:ammonia channel protein AmtB